MQYPEEIIRKFNQLDENLIKAIRRILGNNPTQEQLINFLASNEFDILLNDLGLEGTINEYVTNFDLIFQEKASGYRLVNLTAERIDRISTNIDLIKNTYARTILGYAQANSNLLRAKLIESLVTGVNARQTVKSLEGRLISTLNNSPLTTAQIGSVVQTSYYDYSRATTAEIFKDKPEQRFRYEGGIIPTSSDECAWLFTNQKPEGYTKAEIDVGIETPFIYRSGALKGQIKKIYFTGRYPNYNCIHTWEPI